MRNRRKRSYKTRPYHSYNGRRRGVRRFLTVLAVLLLLGAGSFGAYHYYDELRLLWSGRAASPSPSGQAQPSPTLQIVSASPSTASSPSPSKPKETAPAPAQTIRALFVPAFMLQDPAKLDGLAALARENGLTALVLDMKDDEGYLHYDSDLADAETAEAVVPSAVTAEGISALQEQGLYLVARLSCFKDNLTPRRIQTASFKVQSGVIWLDWYMRTWLDPYSQRARDYLAGISGELSQMGFDEILLDNFQFPVEGKLSSIDYGQQDQDGQGRPAALSALITAVRGQVGENTLVSAAALSSTLLSGSDLQAGQSLAAFDAADRMYVYLPGDNVSDSFDALYEGASSYLGDRLDSSLLPVVPAPDDPMAEDAGERMRTSIGRSGGAKGLGCLIYSPEGLYPEEF